MSTNKTTLAAAALFGLLSAGAMNVNAYAAHVTNNATAALQAQAGDQKSVEKHACKGQNSCKGQGADGKNACKGQGSCATDGSK